MVQIITNSNGGGGGVGVYKYKGSVDYYTDLPSSGMKIGDTYNVVNAFTKDGKDYPAGTNVAWTGTDWDALGGSIDLSEYQKKLVEGAGIDIDGDTNEISVESAVINGAAAGATAVQPGDDVSDLNNDAGYITSSDIPTNVSAFNNDAGYITQSDIPTNVSAFNNDAGYLVSSDLKQSDWNEADSSKIDYIKNKPTIGNATLTIQKNGTNVNTFTANATSNVTANISVPTKTSDITNDSGFIDKDVNNLTNYTLTTSLASVATSGSYNDLSNKPSIPTKTSDLTNDSGFIDKDVNDLTNYTLSSDLSAVATSGSYNDLSNKPTIGAANLTIQKNGTTVATFGANATSGVTANITVPTKVTDLTDSGDYVKSSSLATVATSGSYSDLSNKPTIPGVINNLTSTSTTDALSAYQGKVLKDALDNISGLGKFLSLWDSTTGQPISFPLATPYTYTTGDWFMVETVGTTNYKPNGSSYTGTASTTVESGAVKVGDVYIYDGTAWLLQVNNEPQVSFSDIAGQPTDNTNLASALGAKQDVSNMVTTLSGADNTHYPTAKAVADAISGAGNGDMLKATYDPNNVEANAFDYNNFINTPSLAAVATSGDYSDLSGTPTLASVATSGSYNDLSNKPTIPTVNNATLTIQKNGTTVKTFTANASSDVTANISVPTKTSDITNDSGYITKSVNNLDNYTLSSALATVATTGSYSDLSNKPTIPTDTSDLTNDAGFITGITSGDVTTALGYTPANDSDVVKTSGNQAVNGTKTFGTSPVVPSKTTDATNTGTAVATEAQVYKKQDKLTTQTAYTSKGTSTKVPTITTNTLGQVTGITETNIAFPVSSVNGQTGAVTVQPTLVSGTNIKTVNGNSLLGSGDIVVAGKEYNAGEGIEIGYDYSAMQGPAPSGFHVPLNTEWQAVYDILITTFSMAQNATTMGTYLKMPMAGYRNSSSAGVSGQGTYGLYWSSSRYNANSAYYLSFHSTSINPKNNNYYRTYGLSVRCFKNSPTVPTSSWTKLYGTSIEAGGIFWSSTDGLISLSSDGNTWITIADKNLGATTVWNSGDTLSETNAGKYYQRGNNYGFPRTGTIADTSTTQVDASAYGPGNYYYSSTFITRSSSPYRWDSTDNGNLWGGETGVVTDAITNTGVLSVNGQTGDISNVVTGDGQYVINVSTTAPASGTASNIITIVTD